MDHSIPQYGSRQSLLKRELAIVAGGILLVLLAAYLTWLLAFRQNDPDVVVRKFVEADRAGRYAEQTALVADSVDATVILNLAQTFRRQTGASVFDRYRILSSAVTGDSAHVDVEVTVNPPALFSAPGSPPPSPQTFVVPFKLVRQADRWKIDPTRTVAGLTGVLLAHGLQQIAPTLHNLIPPGLNPGATPPPVITTPPNPNPPTPPTP